MLVEEDPRRDPARDRLAVERNEGGGRQTTRAGLRRRERYEPYSITGSSVPRMTPQRVLDDIIDSFEKADMIDRALPAEAIDSTEAAEPTEPIDRSEPTDPIERTEPFDPIDSSESSDHRERRELLDLVTRTACPMRGLRAQRGVPGAVCARTREPPAAVVSEVDAVGQLVHAADPAHRAHRLRNPGCCDRHDRAS